MRGLFITIEGPEGSGKSTQARRLYEALRPEVPLILAREPGGTPVGEAIRAVLLDERYRGMSAETEMLLFAASRAQYVAEVVRPALEAGTCVLSERFVDASIAYQAYGRGLPVEVVRRVNEVATGGLRPDLTLLLDIDPAVGLARARAARGKEGVPGRGDRLEQEDEAFHARVRAGFLQLAREEPARFEVFDGSRPADEVHAVLAAGVRRLLRARRWPAGAAPAGDPA
ncbi:MAG: dTMP kinase [Armatimonadetes bacterium]|nr:dTMP kinase [Armatimonadota bacterium]